MEFAGTIALMIGVCCCTVSKAQYEDDNVRFTTVPLERADSLFRTLRDPVLLDVRSIEEYECRAPYTFAMVGRMKGAMNIPIDSFELRYTDLAPHKERDVVVYCWTSQRSRRVASALADSGFTRVFNLNGGLSQYWVEQTERLASLRERIEVDLPYTLITGMELCERLAKDPSVQLIDLRSDSAFRWLPGHEIDRDWGRLRSARNIPFDAIQARRPEIDLSKPIMLIDGRDREPEAARILVDMGATDVRVVFRGYSGLAGYGERHCPCREAIMEYGAPYREVADYDLRPTDLTTRFTHIIDVRSDEEYTNTHKQSWRNIGRMKGALHVPSGGISSSGAIAGLDRHAEVLVYAYSANKEAKAAAQSLCDLGFTKVHVLTRGLFGLRWTANNISGYGYLNDHVENVP